MDSNEVPRVATPVDELKLLSLLDSGYMVAFGRSPSLEELGVGWSQVALESGRGRLQWCHNIGNISKGRWIGHYYSLHNLPPPDPKTISFRAYDSGLTGASDYWCFLSDHCPSALPFFERGDAIGAGMELSRLKYYLADAQTYSRGMGSLYAEAVRRKLLEHTEPLQAEPPSPEELEIAGRYWRLIGELG